MSHRVCPYWMGYFLVGGWRRLVQNPERLLRPFVTAGMTVLFLFAMAVVHEIPDHSHLFAQIAQSLNPGGKCLVAEPKMHISAAAFERTLASALQQGLKLLDGPRIAGSHTALLGAAG